MILCASKLQINHQCVHTSCIWYKNRYCDNYEFMMFLVNKWDLCTSLWQTEPRNITKHGKSLLWYVAFCGHDDNYKSPPSRCVFLFSFFNKEKATAIHHCVPLTVEKKAQRKVSEVGLWQLMDKIYAEMHCRQISFLCLRWELKLLETLFENGKSWKESILLREYVHSVSWCSNSKPPLQVLFCRLIYKIKCCIGSDDALQSRFPPTHTQTPVQ